MMHDIVSFVIRKVQIAIAFHHAVDSKRIAFDNCPEYWWFSPDVDGVNLSAIVQQKLHDLNVSSEACPVQRGEPVFAALVRAKVFDYLV